MRSLPLALPLVLLAAAPAFASRPGPYSLPIEPTEPAVVQARADWQSGQFETARRVLQGVLAAKPDDLEANLEMGFLTDALDRESGASLPYFQRAAQNHPDSLEAQDFYIEGLLWDGRYPLALHTAESQIRVWKARSPDKTLLSLLYVGLAGAQGRMAQKGGILDALRYGLSVKGTLEKAVAIDPDCSLALYGLGRFYVQAPGIAGGDVDKGLALMRRAIALDPRDYKLQAVYIASAEAHGHAAQAHQALERYERRFGNLAGARRALDEPLH